MACRFLPVLYLAMFLPDIARAAQAGTKTAPPRLMLWSWFAEDDFRALANGDTGVAYLALSLELQGQKEVIPSPRSTPVRISPKTYQMAVIRLDYRPEAAYRPAFSPTQRRLAVEMIAEIVQLTQPQAIQIDFDAPRSAWPFYRQLITDLRTRLGPGMFLSITALVSWCQAADTWLARLPVDEIVPMAFYMGQATPAVTTMLQQGGRFVSPGCRSSIGLEMEPGRDLNFSIRPHQNQRAYLFPLFSNWSAEMMARAAGAFIP